MKIVTARQGQLQIDSAEALEAAGGSGTGLWGLDHLLPGERLARGSIHELLSEGDGGLPLRVATVFAGYVHQAEGLKAERGAGRTIIWCDRERRLYPPALVAAGISLERLLVLRPKDEADEVWAIAESLRCRGVGVTIGAPRRLTPIQARRLQLAAEAGGGIGILMRPLGAGSGHHAAASRWVVRRVPGERSVQKWELQLIHGHGGRVGKSVVLEVSRETNLVRVFEPVVGGSVLEEARKLA